MVTLRPRCTIQLQQEAIWCLEILALALFSDLWVLTETSRLSQWRMFRNPKTLIELSVSCNHGIARSTVPKGYFFENYCKARCVLSGSEPMSIQNACDEALHALGAAPSVFQKPKSVTLGSVVRAPLNFTSCLSTPALKFTRKHYMGGSKSHGAVI